MALEVICAGCQRTAEAACCARCGATVCVSCRRETHCSRCAFDVVREVLAGRRVPAGPGDTKLTHLFLSHPESDVRIDTRVFEHRRREVFQPDGHARDAAPVVVGQLMDRAGLSHITEPTVAPIRSAPLWCIRNNANPSLVFMSAEAPPAGWSSLGTINPPERCGWFIPGPDSLQILLRERPALPRSPQPIPSEGPFAAIPLSPWSPEPPRFRDEDRPRRCPHCQNPATRYRVHADMLICLSCGRSFNMESLP